VTLSVSSSSPQLALNGVSKRFRALVAVDDVSLDVGRGEWLSLLGPSGCGKTTTLRMIAGFMLPDEGSITISGRDVTTVPPYRRNTGMVFQSYALFPHLTVEQNVAYGLRFRKVPAPEKQRRVAEALNLVQLAGFEKRYPTRELSGGQQQRVALARALVIEPDVLLLDEPLSNLDARLREDLCVEMAQLQRRLQLTTVYVTHDQGEALSMSSRVAVMNRGRIDQIGAPDEIYHRPASLFVADFLGSVNKIPATVVARNGSTSEVAVNDARTPLLLKSSAIATAAPGAAVVAAIRPERIRLSNRYNGSVANELPGTVRHIAFYGNERRYKVDIGTAAPLTVLTATDSDVAAHLGDSVVLAFAAPDCWIYDATGPSSH
jgi:spermidine/putrescine ABC transporter ATP-binding subunit